MRGLRAPHSLYVRAENRRNQAVLEMRGFLSSLTLAGRVLTAQREK